MQRRFVFIATLMMELDPADNVVQTFKEAFPDAIQPQSDGPWNIDLLEGGQIDGANGGGGDGTGANLAMHISASGLTAQRFVTSPMPYRNDQTPANENINPGRRFYHVKTPAALTAEVCFVFNTRAAYERHMANHKAFYQRYFAYATTILGTKIS
jgi:hypothetical protein